MTTTAVAPAAARRRIPAWPRLPLRAGQAALPVAGAPADPRVLDRAGALLVVVVSQQSTLPADTLFGRWMHATRLGRIAGGARLRRHLGASAAHLAGRRRRVRRRGPARHLAPPARRGPLAAADLRGQGAGQPHRDPAAGGRAGRLQRGRGPCRREPAADRPGRPPARPGGRGRKGCCSPGSACWPRPWRSPRSGCSGRSPWGAPRWGCCCPPSSRWRMQLAPRCCRCRSPSALALPSYAFIAWHGLFTSPAQLGPAADRRRGQPGVGRRRDRPGVPAVHAARLHQRHRTTVSVRRRSPSASLPLAVLFALIAAVLALAAPGPGAPGSSRASCSSRWRRRSRTSTGCRPGNCTGLHVTEAQLRASASCDKGGGLVADQRSGKRLALHRVLAPPRRRRRGAGRSTSSTSPRTAGTSPTATDRSR